MLLVRVVLFCVNLDTVFQPGRGNFVVSVNGHNVVELLGLKRPFPPLKALNMEEVNANVLKALDK